MQRIDPMTAAEYYDWWFYSGLCPGIPTRPANYSFLRDRLSEAGLHLIVLWDLVLDNRGYAETSYAGYQGIYGAAARLAAAARAVGARRLAAFMAAPGKTEVVPETHKELKRLLKTFTARHDSVLAADIARHGDPRSRPGFGKWRARRSRDRLWGENNARYHLADQLPFFAPAMAELRTLLAGGLALTEIADRNRDLARLACCLQHDVPRWASSEQAPEVVAFVEECRRLFHEYPEQLPAWGRPDV
jgi:hypothetical protein